jgi:hypothetical protein
MTSRTLSIVVLAAVLGTSAVASGQSLAEVAREEAARRAAVKSPGKLYTNESLKPAPQPEPVQAAPAETTPPEATTAPAVTPAPAAKSADQSTDAKNDEATWRKRIATEREALDRSKMFADALQSRINALTTDFTNRDDPVQRQQIGADRQKALDELDRVKKEIADHTKAIATIQDDARKAGVPPGWVR